MNDTLLGQPITKPHETALIQLIQASVPVSNMALTLALHPRTVEREIARLCALHSLTYTPAGAGRGIVQSVVKPSTFSFRVNLANWLTSYRDFWPKELTNREMALAAGITNRAIGRATVRPYSHNWTITEIARVARAVGSTFDALVADCTSRSPSNLPVITNPIRPEEMDLQA